MKRNLPPKTSRLQAMLLAISSLFLAAACSSDTISVNPSDCKTLSPNDYYFPPTSLNEERPNADALERRWFSKHLRAALQPSLSCGAELPEAYRFLWLRSFDHPIVVMLRPNGTSWHIIAVMLDGAGGYDPGKPLQNVSRKLTQHETEAALSLAQRIWVIPRQPITFGHDGAEWILEARKNGRYRVLHTWSPKSGEIRDIGLGLLRLANLMPSGTEADPIY